MGQAIIKCKDATIAAETCEELWVMKSPHEDYFLAGVDIVTNSSGSHHELRKLELKLDMVR